MNKTLNGNGNGTNVFIRQLEKKTTKPHVAATPSAFKESEVTFQTSEGVESRGTLVRMTRHMVVFELYNPVTTPRFSEALEEFKIILRERTIYSGRMVVGSVVDMGAKIICEAIPNDAHWKDTDIDSALKQSGALARNFKLFFQEWQRLYKVLPEFKIVVADIKIFLTDLRLWLEQVELSVRSLPKNEHLQMEESIIDTLSPLVIPMLDTLFEKFEIIASQLSEDMRASHRNYIQRHLHSIVLHAPFASRTYRKPLGYAGDYEMVNMMARDPKEGATVFAKIFNVWLLQQNSALAHRNRLTHLTKCIEAETLRISRAGNKARVYNFACGPAIEIQHFLSTSLLCEKVEFILSDFNGETLEFTKNAVDKIKKQFGWQTPFKFQKKTVQQLVKENQKHLIGKDGIKPEYDFVYCAGLFDYLPDSTCKQLIKIFYEWLAPGGLLLLTNVTPLTANRGSLELILDWHLIYREAAQFERLCSDIISKENIRVHSDATGVNIFLELRKSKRE